MALFHIAMLIFFLMPILKAHYIPGNKDDVYNLCFN